MDPRIITDCLIPLKAEGHLGAEKQFHLNPGPRHSWLSPLWKSCQRERSPLPTASCCDRTGSPAARRPWQKMRLSSSCSECPRRNRRGDSRYFGSFPVDLGMSSTILSRPSPHLSFTIPQAIRKVSARSHFVETGGPQLTALTLGQQGEGPMRPLRTVLGRRVCVSTQTVASPSSAGAIFWLHSKLLCKEGGKGSHWRAEQEKEE